MENQTAKASDNQTALEKARVCANAGNYVAAQTWAAIAQAEAAQEAQATLQELTRELSRRNARP